MTKPKPTDEQRHEFLNTPEAKDLVKYHGHRNKVYGITPPPNWLEHATARWLESRKAMPDAFAIPNPNEIVEALFRDSFDDTNIIYSDGSRMSVKGNALEAVLAILVSRGENVIQSGNHVTSRSPLHSAPMSAMGNHQIDPTAYLAFQTRPLTDAGRMAIMERDLLRQKVVRLRQEVAELKVELRRQLEAATARELTAAAESPPAEPLAEWSQPNPLPRGMR